MLDVMADPHFSPAAAILMLRDLQIAQGLSDTPSDWVCLYKNAVSQFQKRFFLIQLFTRHGVGVTLKTVASWNCLKVDEISVESLGMFTGPPPPMRMGLSDVSRFSLSLNIPDGNPSKIYIAVSKMNLSKFLDGLSGGRDSRDKCILDAGAVEYYETGHAVRWFQGLASEMERF